MVGFAAEVEGHVRRSGELLKDFVIEGQEKLVWLSRKLAGVVWLVRVVQKRSGGRQKLKRKILKANR